MSEQRDKAIERLVSARSQSDAAAQARIMADAKRQQAIIEARKAKLTIREIGEVLGLTHGRVQQIISDVERSRV